MQWITARGGRESGQMLVLFVLALGVLMGFVAMSIDVGLILHERRSAQNAADAAALAGARDLPQSASAAVLAAQQWAVQNGFSSEDGATITVNTPYQGNPGAVEVIIEEETPFLFARALGLDSVNVHARAVAIRDNSGADGIALLVLNPWGGVSFDKTGSGDLIINGGGAVMVNDAWQWAIERAGVGDVITSGGFFHYYEGGWYSDGSGEFVPEPSPVSYQLPDPLEDLEPPDPYAVTSPDSGGSAANPRTKTLNGGNHTLHPGTYWGGIEIRSSANATFEPGIYVLAGGGLKLTGSGGITGNGVFFYNSFDPENQNANADGRCDEINLRGSASFSLTAPTDGPYEDILFWQDEACTNPMKHEGNSDLTSGVIYLPGARLDLSASGNIGTVQIITDTVDISGSSDLIIDFENFLDLPAPGGVKLTE